MTLGAKKLRRLVEERGTAAAAARAIGVSNATIHDYVHGKKRPTGPRVARIELWSQGRITADDWLTGAEKRALEAARAAAGTIG